MVMLKVWKWYQKCMAVHPVKTQVVSSGLLWGVGDIVAQSITHSNSQKKKRLQITTTHIFMTSTRCAVCKYFRRRCHSDCIFSPYFPANNPQRFACVHRIYGASNIGKMLEQLPVHLRGDAVESLYYEAICRIQDPVYGCVGIISLLHQQVHDVQSQLAKAQAETAFFNANKYSIPEPPPGQQQEPVPIPAASFNSTMTLPEQNSSAAPAPPLSPNYGFSNSPNWFY